jgi:fumarate reductase (CoM/CoB) subunit A
MKKAQYDHLTTDILIIGGGGAAAMAALSAAKSGAKVAIVSKETSLVGGATIQAAGGISCLVEPNDSPQLFYEDIMRGGGNLNNPALVKILVEESLSGLLKLAEYHYHLDMDGTNKFHRITGGEGHSWPRMYMDRRESVDLCHALGRMLIFKDVDFYPEVVLERLLVNDGQMVGALGFHMASGRFHVFNAKAVILATGGLGQLYQFTTNARTLTGDGYAMAWDAGAEFVDMEMVQFIPLAFPYPRAWKGTLIGPCSLWGPKVRLFNGLGERYMERYDPERLEYTTRDTVSRANFTEISEGRGTGRGAIVVDPTENDLELLPGYQESVPFIYGRVKKIFGTEAGEWRIPFEAIPSQHFFMGGVRIDQECKTSLPGLFAVGEVAGGVHGANRLIGNALSEIFVFGDIAGRHAAKWASKTGLVQPDGGVLEADIEGLEALFESRGNGLRPGRIKERIKEVMWQDVGPVRSAEGLEKAAGALADLHKDAMHHMSLRSDHRTYNLERAEACEVKSMLKTASLIVQSARLREESRGSHYRGDFPASDDPNWLKNIVLTKDKNGETVVRFTRAGGDD